MKDLRDMTIREIETAYKADVRSIAEEAVELDTYDRTRYYIHESVDGCEWVIYTYRSMLVPVVSEHPDAYDQEFGGVPDGDMKEAQIAYSAMVADVWDHVEMLEREKEEEEEESQD